MAKMTNAQKKACLKYQKTLGQISIRLPKQELARYKEAARSEGMPFRAWVLERLNEGLDTGNLFIKVAKKSKKYVDSY